MSNSSFESNSNINENKEEIANAKILDNKMELTVELDINNVNCLTENLKICNIVNSTNENEKLDSDEFRQNKELRNCQNNNSNRICGITCASNNSTKLESNIEKNSSEQNGCLNLNNSDEKESENCKRVVYEFYQNLKLDIDTFNHILNDRPSVKHIAHLDIEASIKKELENTVLEFENKRINSPNPIAILIEVRNFINQLKF